jgi:hypothetical protein
MNGSHEIHNITSSVDHPGSDPVGPLVMVAMYLTEAPTLYKRSIGTHKPYRRRVNDTNKSYGAEL